MASASSGPMIAFGLFKPEDYKAMFAKHAWTDRSEVDIDQYLTPKERIETCDYEKDRMRNIKKNYDVMVDMGLPAKPPYFMLKNRPKFMQPISDSESDSEWVPSSRRKSKKQPINAGWKPPVKRRTEGTLKKVMPGSTKSSFKGKPTKTKPKGKSRPGTSKGKAAKPAGNKTSQGSSQKLPDSDSDEPEFDGFSETEISANEVWTAEIVSRNDDILNAIEEGTYHFDLSDDEEEGDSDQESPAPSEKTEPEGPATETVAETPSRYPRRSITRKVYTEPEVPKDDDYLYCEECDHDYEGDCPVHGPLIIIPDTEVANDGSDPDRAVHSLPKGLVVRKSQIPLAGEGVWAEHQVPKGARFGPYEGIKEDDGDEAHKSGYCWVIYADGKEVSHYVDAGDKSQANWLRYVNCARNEGEQNLLAYQFHGEVYYRTVQEVKPGQELLVWYGDEYGRELGLLGEEAGDVQQLFHDAGFEVFTCEVCGRVFPSETWRDGHRKAHGDRTGSKRHTCTQCSYSTDNSANYNRHLLTHSGDRPFTCTECGKGFTQSGNLTVHQRLHTGVKPYKCDVCGRGFNQSAPLQRHSRTHTGEAPYKCPVCGQGFNRTNTLTAHMSKHTGVLPYVCQTCGQGFTRSNNLNTHMRTHTGERPYVCNTCGQGFTRTSYLKHHTYTHTGQWPHTCIECGHGFALPSELRKHMERVHRH